MPWYNFELHDGPIMTKSRRRRLSEMQAARREAVRLTCKMLCGNSTRLWDGGDQCIVVKDEEGVELFTLHFLAIDAPRQQRPALSGKANNTHQASYRSPALRRAS